jgi:tripartite-type tricarboxylate transporter receptor subunit TctC
MFIPLCAARENNVIELQKEDDMEKLHLFEKKKAFYYFIAAVTLIGSFCGWQADAIIAAEVFPSKPIAYAVFYAPGGKSDLSARMFAPYLQKYVGTPVVVTNIPGAVGTIGHKAVKDAAADGYTLGHSGGTIVAQYTRPGVSRHDYAYIARIYSTPYVIAVSSASPFKTFKELVEFAKANPKKLKHGNTGHGSTPHLTSASLQLELGIEFTEVTYKGEGPAVVGLAANEVEVVVGTTLAFKPLVDAGKLRILAIFGDKRLRGQFNQVPTCKELGYNFESIVWEAAFGPKGLRENKAVFSKLSEAMQKAILDPEFGQKLETLGYDQAYLAGDHLERWLNEEDERWKKVIFRLGLQYK